MDIITLKLTEIHQPEKNVRIHTENQINEFMRSLDMFGQTRPAVIDENNTVLVGNGMVTALTKLGVDTIDCYKITNLTENQKKKLMISDNKIFNLGIDNFDVLNSFLDDLQGDLDVPGYPAELLESMTATAEEITETISDYGSLDETEIDEIKESKERKEKRIEVALKQGTPTSEDTEEKSADNSTPVTSSEHNSSEDTEEVAEYILCPHCGEKVWL